MLGGTSCPLPPVCHLGTPTPGGPRLLITHHSRVSHRDVPPGVVTSRPFGPRHSSAQTSAKSHPVSPPSARPPSLPGLPVRADPPEPPRPASPGAARPRPAPPLPRYRPGTAPVPPLHPRAAQPEPQPAALERCFHHEASERTARSHRRAAAAAASCLSLGSGVTSSPLCPTNWFPGLSLKLPPGTPAPLASLVGP